MSTIVGAVERLLLRLGIVSGFATLAIMLIVVIDVVGRAFFNAPLDSGIEISELLLVALVFFGLAAAQQERQNFAIDILVRHFSPGVQRGFEVVAYIFSLEIVIFLAWPSTKQALSSFERGETGFGMVPFPIWPARLILAVGFWLLALQFVIDIGRLLTGHTKAPSSEAPQHTGLE